MILWDAYHKIKVNNGANVRLKGELPNKTQMVYEFARAVIANSTQPVAQTREIFVLTIPETLSPKN